MSKKKPIQEPTKRAAWGEMLTKEELLALLQQLVESGQVSPEEAQQVAQELSEGAGDGEGGAAKEASGAFADVFNAMNILVP